MSNAFVIVRVSAEDQLKGYGPDVQWEDDILPMAVLTRNTVIINVAAPGHMRIQVVFANRSMY
jgi:hypothetical protein